MKTTVIFLLFLAFSMCSEAQFKSAQLKFERVRDAQTAKGAFVKALCEKNGIPLNELELFVRVFKHEQELEVWGKKRSEPSFKLLITYPFCSTSGDLGPKRVQGDYQIPEGFYFIDRFNPYSNFHLSLGVNYPNASDKKLSDPKRPGGDIFIHGSCVTIGCIPLTDEKIQELYLLAVEARNNGQEKIEVHYFPFRMTKANVTNMTSKPAYAKFASFWATLQSGHDAFEETKMLPTIGVGEKGEYVVRE